jgi:pimeloyl-ACP methyl ester carboxylesterase
MKRAIGTYLFVIIWCLVLCGLSEAQQDPIIGHWEGAYVRLGAIQTVSCDFFVEDGKLRGTYDIADLSVFGEPIKDIEYKFPMLVMNPRYGKFTIQVFADIGEMTGENKGWNPPLALHLKRTSKPPLQAYPIEDVKFKNGSVTLSGTLVKPITNGPWPVLVVVHGSGSQGRDDSFYRFWGEFFAEHGFAALIYDKRGVGHSTGDYQRASFDDLAGDAVAAVQLLRKRKDINVQQIGLFGISQGGWLAPLAASRSTDIKFLILDVGPAVTVEEQELNSVEYRMRNDEFSEQDIAEAVAYTKQVFKTAYSGEGKSELDALTARVRDKKWAEYVQLVESQKELDDWRRIRYDPAPVLKQIRIPVLSIFGEKDVLVPPKENREKMESYLKKAGNKDVTIHIIPEVGHDMTTFQTLRGGEWKWPEKFWVWPKRSRVFYETVIGWLNNHTTNAK